MDSRQTPRISWSGRSFRTAGTAPDLVMQPRGFIDHDVETPRPGASPLRHHVAGGFPRVVFPDLWDSCGLFVAGMKDESMPPPQHFARS